MLKFINRKRMPSGGTVQDVTQQAFVTSVPNITADYLNDGNVGPSMLAYQDPYQQAVGSIPNTFMDYSNSVSRSTNLQTSMLQGDPVAPPTAYNPNDFPSAASSGNNNKTVTQQVDDDNTQENRSQDGNPFDAMTQPYFYSPDLGSRAAMLGRSLGRIGSYKNMWRNSENAGQRAATIGAGTANAAQGILAGASLGLGLARSIYGAASEEHARQQDLLGRREKLRNERVNSFMRYEAGGPTPAGAGQFYSGSLTGEYAYPLPKSMEDNANVEVERGEYILRPDVETPMEALGNRHENGGTPMDLPEGTHVVSDYRKITPEFVEYLYDNYGIRASVRDTYASVLDKYKSKIGLKDLYDKQEKVYARLKKNQDVKDENTSNLNKSVLSKFVSENQAEIDALEPDFRRFSDMVYEAQEASKRKDRMDRFFREGGKVDEKKIKIYAKQAGISEDRARSLIYDAYRSSLKKMPDGGPTDQQKKWAQAVNRLIQDVYGRQLTFSRVDVPGAENILNPGTSATDNQGLQHVNATVPTTYGRNNREALGNLLSVNRWARRYQDLGDQGSVNDFDTLAFQNEYNNRLNMFDALGQAGAVSNSSDTQSFRQNYGFWTDPATGVIRAGRDDLDSRRTDDLLGQYTLTRSYGGFDVITPEEKKKLNEAGITNFVDLWGENKDKVRKILSDDSYNRLKQLQDSGLFGNFDFVLEANNTPPVAEEPAPAPTPDPVPKQEAPAAPAKPNTQSVVTDRDPVNPKEPEDEDTPRGRNVFSGGLMFPEILRPMSSGIITEGLERHQPAHMDPVTSSADQYINELNRVTSAQMDALGDVPDSQRGAVLANLNAIAGTNIGNYIARNDYQNAARREDARRYNSEQYVVADDKNIAERQRYEASTLKAMAIDDENRARYLDSLNQEAQQKFNTWTTLNTIRSIAPDMRMLPNGQIVYSNNGDVVSGDWSSALLDEMERRYSNTRTTRRTKNSDGSTTTVTQSNRWGGRIY